MSSDFKTYVLAWIFIPIFMLLDYRSRLLTVYDPMTREESAICSICVCIRNNINIRIKGVVPSPSSELLLGTTLGINELKSNPRFNDVLLSTGTVHIIVVSGFNLSLILNKFLSVLSRNKNFISYLLLQICAFIYALLTGLHPPILRALLMASLTLWAQYLGRNTNQLHVLYLSAAFIVIFNPSMLADLSFQLSYLATLGLIIGSPPLEKLLAYLLGTNFFSKDTATSLAAQMFVLPVLLIYFNKFNVFSPIVNGLILWSIPYLTIVGFVVILGTFLNDFIGQILGALFHSISSIIIYLLYIFDSFAWHQIVLNIPIYFCLAYYSVLLYVFMSTRCKWH